MLELPETINIAKQLKEHVAGKKVIKVRPPTKEHKFCWFSLEPVDYCYELADSEVVSAEGIGIYVELSFNNGKRLCFNDGVNARLVAMDEIPANYQLLIEFEDETALAFTVAMYGGIILHDGSYDNEYYLKSKASISPFSDEFDAYFHELLFGSKPSLSAKAFLATEQRFPGIGNGVLQDILLVAGIHPKRKIATLSASEWDKLLNSIKSVLHEMCACGGRDTEKDIFGSPGGYRVKLSKNTLSGGCALCGGEIKKATYLGGAIYFCPACQPLQE